MSSHVIRKIAIHLLLLLFSSVLPPISSRSAPPPSPLIGVTYHRGVQGLRNPDRVVSALRSAGIAHALLPDPDPEIIRAFLYSGISLLLSIPNSVVADLASNRSSAFLWIADHVSPFYPRVQILTIAVGNGLFSANTYSDPDLSDSLLSAIQNLRAACLDLGLPKIPISTVHSFEIVNPVFPPSAARFQESLSEPYVKPLLEFLASTGAPFLVDLYPYDLYRRDGGIPIGYAMFEEEAFSYREDPGSGLRYRNLFDSMVDAVIGAMAAMGHRRVPVVVSGTGWPSRSEDRREREATVEMARRYNGGLLKHLKSGAGTPMRRNGVDGVYIYELFDGSQGREAGSHWGVWYANLSAKYEIAFSGSGDGRRQGLRLKLLLQILAVVFVCCLIRFME